MVRSVRRDSRIASAATRRSPRTSVRSLASIATSVPVPIARPRSAWASAAASLTPSPTIATTRPSRLQPPSRRRPCPAGSTSAMTVGVDADLARRRRAATAALSPVSSTGREARAPAAARTAWALRRLDRVGDRRGHRAGRAVPGDGDGGAAGVAARRRAAASRSRRQLLATTRRAAGGRPTRTAWPSTTPCTPSPCGAGEALDRRAALRRVRRHRRRSPGRSGARCRLEGAGEAQQLVGVDAVGRRRRRPGSSRRS